MRLLAPRNSIVSTLQLVLLALVTATLLWTCAVKARTPAAIASIAFGVLWLLRFEWSSTPIRLWQGAPQAALRYFRRLDYSLLGALPIVYALSMLYTGDLSFTLKHLRLTLTLMGVSGVLYVYRDALMPYRRWAWHILIFFSAVSALGCIVYVLANKQALVSMLGTGSAVPTPRAHVRTATLFAFAALAGVYQLTIKRNTSAIRIAVGIATAVLTVAIHLIAVRTGLVLLYIGVSLYALRLVFTRIRSRWVATGLLVGLGLSLLVATQLPTVQRRIEYMRFDFERRSEADALKYSDASRMISLQAAWQIVRDAPMLGAHKEGLREEMKSAYAKTGHDGAYLLPTNQFMFSWGLAGVAGLLGVLAFFIGPMLEPGWLRRPLLAEYLLLTFLLCLVETPFANDVGVALSVLVVCFAKAGPIEHAATTQSPDA